MRWRSRNRDKQRGLTLVELLIAAVILAVSLMGLLNLGLYTYSLTRSNDEVATAYSLGRAAVERLRGMGYVFARPSDVPQWYSVDMQALGSSAGAYYRVDTSLINGEDAPAAHLNLREIVVVVTRVSDGTELYRTHTYLAIGGS